MTQVILRQQKIICVILVLVGEVWPTYNSPFRYF
jgi:hypothetical protein